MKPTNYNDRGCEPNSSACVIWTGEDIPCIKLCKGDSINEVIAALAEELCTILDTFKISSYDLGCLDIKTCPPETFQALVQLLIDRICALEGVTPEGNGTSSGCPNCVINIPQCLQVILGDQLIAANGDQITSMVLDQYVSMLANAMCTLFTSIENLTNSIADLEIRVSALEVSNTRTTPAQVSITPVCVSESIPTPLSEVVQSLERAFCELQSATGQPTQLFSAITAQCNGLNTAPSLGTHGGTMSSIEGWVNSPQNAADTLNNLWLTICDIRSSLVNIRANCCDTSCNSVAVSLVATMPSSVNLVLFFQGSIPNNLTECNLAGTLISIADQSGNSISVTVPLIANINNISGYPIDLTSTPINTADDLTITSTMCFKDDANGSVCQSILSYTFVNTADCPTVGYIASQTGISYSFSHTSGTKTYVVELYDSLGTTLLQSQTFPVTNPTTVAGSFSGLTTNTVYKVRVRIVTTTRTTICPFAPVTTLFSLCPPPQTVVAILTID